MAGIGETIRENAGALLANLQKDPLTTLVGQKIAQATDASLASENWALNMEICDIICDTDEGPRDAGKAIRKRLMTNAGKNYNVVMYTLTVLETCVKNCGRRFHLVVSQKDFVLELVRLIGPKNDPPTAVQEKVLSLIQNWASAFRANPDMQGVVQVYADLKSKGVEFPAPDMETMVPIHTPQRSVLPPTQEYRPTSSSSVRMGSAMHGELVPSMPVFLTAERADKLKQELEMVQRNSQVFSEMLNELEPGHEHPRDWELLQELLKSCHAMQTRIVELIEKVANEDITSELLRLNDELNNLFVRYERFEKRRSTLVAKNRAATGESGKSVNSPSLIDFGTGDGAAGFTDDLKNLSLTDTSTKPKSSKTVPENDEFEAFAQARTAKDTATESARSRAVSSSEFDKFLQERAAAAERLPSIEARTGSKEKDDDVNLLAL